MLVTTIDLVELEPGGYLQWQSPPPPPGLLSDIPPSVNQNFHLSHALKDSEETETCSGGWLAATFDVPGPILVDALTESFTALMRRHESLRCSFEKTDGKIVRRVYPDHDVAFVAPGAPVLVRSAEDAQAALRHSLSSACDPTRFPAVLFAALDRPETSTVVCGFDHSAVDMLSLALIVRELRDDYSARVAGRATPELAPVGSFLEYCAYETGQHPPSQTRLGLEIWREFLASQGGVFPGFPLDLGVSPGEVAAQRTAVFQLLDSAEADAFEAICESHEGKIFSGELTALATAVRELGGPDQIATLTPISTRIRPEWAEAVGWFVTNIPLVFGCGADFADGTRQNRASFRAALPAAKVPIGQVISGQAGPFSFARKDVSMVSHIDYRRVFGPKPDLALRATHISNATVADDAQFWFSRTGEGLWLRVRHPDTAIASATIGQLRERLGEVLGKQL
ncbi:MAG: condensation domain-containing protein [Segniliparus sp.]|uniref:condensation domain-containing protein n=1 Tax=Segniliparus sp. TaxID=2804064 RepID=UPI003F30B1BD